MEVPFYKIREEKFFPSLGLSIVIDLVVCFGKFGEKILICSFSIFLMKIVNPESHLKHLQFKTFAIFIKNAKNGRKEITLIKFEL